MQHTTYWYTIRPPYSPRGTRDRSTYSYVYRTQLADMYWYGTRGTRTNVAGTIVNGTSFDEILLLLVLFFPFLGRPSCAVLCCAVLCCAVLCCAVLCGRRGSGDGCSGRREARACCRLGQDRVSPSGRRAAKRLRWVH